MRREDLTPKQAEAAEAIERRVLVLGGPGSGKTTTALWTARVELERPQTHRWQRVLFLTFSRTAVSQIARRAPRVFEGHRDQIEIATFHGFAYRLLTAFGRYGGHGTVAPRVQSEAELKLLGPREGHISYDEILPAAQLLLRSRRLHTLLSRRYPLVICDEFQDTSDQQWSFLEGFTAEARLLLLADPNQMIYTFIPGVSAQRLEAARASVDRDIQLEPRSHRDPSGMIPAMAEAVRQRQFDDEAVRVAVDGNRLHVHNAVEDGELLGVVAGAISSARAAGSVSIGVFAHSNEGVATLSTALADAAIDHVLVGIPESHAEALRSMAVLCAFAVGTAAREEVEARLAIFLTACTRGAVPELAVKLVRGLEIDPGLARLFNALFTSLQRAARGTMGDVAKAAATAWPRLRVQRGGRPWRRAAPVFLAMARPFFRVAASPEAARRLMTAVERRRPLALLDFDTVSPGPIQLMNFHQTKGREADAVVLVYRDGDWFGNEREPFPKASRVLFVSLTRARQRVTVILSPHPHPLVSPFARWG